MPSQSHTVEAGDATLQVENVGGIEETSVTFSPGVTILVGRNATNRTSFLQAVMAALGSDDVSIKGDADEATIELNLGDETYTRQLTRDGASIVASGEPYLDDPTVADLFAFLLESNDARRAVANSQDLRELIMRPVDTDEIQAEIDRLAQRRERLESELDELEELKGKLPELEEKRGRLVTEIEEKKTELDAKEAELEDADADVEESREAESELEERLEKLRAKRSNLDDVRYDLETERESHESLRKERQELAAELEELPETPVGEVDELESRIGRLREQKQTVEKDVSELQSVIGFNEEMLEEGAANAFQDFEGDSADDVTAELLDDDEVTCWTCGTDVEKDQIEATIDWLRELSASKIGELEDIDTEIDELTDEKRSLERAQQERERIDRRLTELADEIKQGEERIDRLQERRTAITDEIELVEEAVDDLDDDSSEVLDLHKEANQLEYELGRLENELEGIEDDISDVEARVEEQGDVEAELDEVDTEIEELRTKIDRLEADAVDQFNDHMDTVLDLLDYPNLERVWLERVERETRQGRRKVPKNVFELHVVRSSESGVAYEDTVDHLSESEREVTGLVFALAGYFAHDVHEEVPFVLLDSLEAIDAGRISALIQYFEDYAEYLLVALLPEDAEALPGGYERITEI